MFFSYSRLLQFFSSFFPFFICTFLYHRYPFWFFFGYKFYITLNKTYSKIINQITKSLVQKRRRISIRTI